MGLEHLQLAGGFSLEDELAQLGLEAFAAGDVLLLVRVAAASDAFDRTGKLRRALVEAAR